MPKIEIETAPSWTGSDYPAPYAGWMGDRRAFALGEAGGLTQMGVRLTVLRPGAQSALRHWHEEQDEFAIVVSGELVLIEDEGETVMRAGDCAAFPAGRPNGHHFVNRSGAEARLLAIGTETATEIAHYTGVDLMVTERGGRSTYTRRDGSPLPAD